MNKSKYDVEVRFDEDPALYESIYEESLEFILGETECFIHNSKEMRAYIRENTDKEINNPTELYNWAKRHFNKCHVMLIEKYEHGRIWFSAVELDYVPTCRFDSGIVGIIAVPKKRFRNPEKTKKFMIDLVADFSKSINESFYDIEVVNLQTRTKTFYQTVSSNIAYDVEHAKNDEELEKILNQLEAIDEYSLDEIA